MSHNQTASSLPWQLTAAALATATAAAVSSVDCSLAGNRSSTADSPSKLPPKTPPLTTDRPSDDPESRLRNGDACDIGVTPYTLSRPLPNAACELRRNAAESISMLAVKGRYDPVTDPATEAARDPCPNGRYGISAKMTAASASSCRLHRSLSPLLYVIAAAGHATDEAHHVIQ